jgi:hypothetical protein
VTGEADAQRFDELAASHAGAFGGAAPELRADVLWAGLTVRVEIAGPRLARLFHRAVAHLAQPPRTPAARCDLSVRLAEPRAGAVQRLLAEVGERLPRRWTRPDLEVRSSACGRVLGVAFEQRSRYLLDRQNRVLLGVQDPDQLQLFERTKPLLLPLRAFLQDRGIHVVHAGLVVADGVGVLIAGPKGAGKSSTALRCFLAGCDLLGDDQVAVVAGTELVGHSLYAAAHLEPDWLPSIGAFPAHALDRDAESEKLGIFLAEVAPERLRRSVPIGAVVLPRPTPGRPTGIAPASKAEAMMRMAPSTLLLPLGGGGDAVRALRALVERAPAYWLDAGADAAAVAAAVREAAGRSVQR